MKSTLEHVTLARIPASALRSLAGLRGNEGILVRLEGDSAWVAWEDGDDRVLRAILPAAGIELFERRGDAWHRPGQRLPAFGVSPVGEPIPLARAVIPAPFSAERPSGDPIRPSAIRLVRGGRPRPATAALCPMSEVGRWADSATSAELEAVRGAVCGDLALLIGSPPPPLPGAERYWGSRVLVPMGFETRPMLPERAIAEAMGGAVDEVIRLIPDGGGVIVEAIPGEAFRPLTRAGVRLAAGGWRP